MITALIFAAASASSSFDAKVENYVRAAQATGDQCLSQEVYVAALEVAHGLATLDSLVANPRTGAGSRYIYRQMLARDGPRFVGETATLAERQISNRCFDEADKIYRNVIWHFDQNRAQLGIDDVRAARK